MACFGGGGGSKPSSNVPAGTDPEIAFKPFLEVSLTLGNSSRETIVLLNKQGDYLPGQTGGDSARANRPPK